MQLIRLSLAATLLLSSMQADDYVNVQFLQYNEHNERASISSPSAEVNIDFGTDYTLNGTYTLDSISGASPTYYDASSGASAYSRGENSRENVTYGPIEYEETKRMVGSLHGTMRLANRDEITLGGSFSNEIDYRSAVISLEGMHYLDTSKNSTFTLGLSFQKDNILIECRQNSNCDASSGASKKLRADTITSQATFSQNLDSSSVLKTSLFFSNADGYLSNPFMNVVRNFDTTPRITNDNRPEHRRGYGGVIKYIKSLDARTTLHTSYRLYHDNWEVNSHTWDNSLYYEMNPSLTWGFGLRYYLQDSAYFYSGSAETFTDEIYASSDERLGSFDTVNLSLNADYKLNDNLVYHLGANYYTQNKGTTARYFTTGLKYTF